LTLIYEKLGNTLTKNDTGFLKQIIKDTICELKDDLLKSLIPRIEILESDVMDQAKEIEQLKKEISKKDSEIANLTEYNKRLI
jgi:cell division protein FtsB